MKKQSTTTITRRPRCYRIENLVATVTTTLVLLSASWWNTGGTHSQRTAVGVGVVHALTPSSSSKAPKNTPRNAFVNRQASISTDPEVSNSRPPSSSSSTSDWYLDDLDSLTPAQIERRIVQAGRQGRTDQALQIYSQVKQPVIRQVNAAIDACARARPVRLGQAFCLLDACPVKPNVYTFGSLMHACARAGDVDRAVQLLQDMQGPRYGVTPNAVVYHAAVSACNRATPPAVDTAWQLLQQAQKEHNLALSTVGYNAALSAAARAGQVEKAVALLEQMQQADKNPLVPAPDAVTYGTLLAAFEHVQDWNSLMKYATRMQEAGFELDGMAITSILHACQQLGLADQAVEYLERMKHVGPYRRQTAGNQVAGRRKPLMGPDAVAFLLAISACARGGAWKRGLQLLDQYTVTGSTDDVAVFTAAVRGCELAGEYPTAFLLLERMRQLNVPPNEMTFAAVLGACATAAAKTNDKEVRQAALSKAMRLLRVLRKDPSTVDPNIQIYNAAVRVCAEAHDVEQAFAVVDELATVDELEPNVVTYGTLMSACEREGSLDDVNKVFQRMRGDGIPANEVVYGAAISCCRKAGDAERALLLLRKMIRDGLQPNIVTFNTVLTAQVEAKGRGPRELERATIVFQLLCSKKYSSAMPNRQTYNLMVRFLAECQRPREAQVLLRKMRQDHNYVPDVHLYTAVVAAFERSGQPLKALRLMESMNADGYDFYEAKVLNAAFKRALKVANVMGRGFSGVHDDEEDDEEEEGGAAASSLHAQVESEIFLKGTQLSMEDDDDTNLSP